MEKRRLMDDELLTTHDVTKIFKVNRVTVAKWVNAGKLPAFKTLGGNLRFRKSEIVRFLRESGLPVPESLASSEPSILIVDDEPAVLESVRRLVEGHFPGRPVDTADNGIQALLKIARAKPALLVLDIVMPEMDGIQVIRRIREDPGLRDIKIVVISAYSEPGESAALEAGAEAFFKKGSPMSELMDILSSLLPARSERQKTSQP